MLEIRSEIQRRIESLEQKMNAMQDNAGNKGRSLTVKEQVRFDDLHRELVNLYCEDNDLQIAICAISDY